MSSLRSTSTARSHPQVGASACSVSAMGNRNSEVISGEEKKNDENY